MSEYLVLQDSKGKYALESGAGFIILDQSTVIISGEPMGMTELGKVMDAIADAITTAGITQRAYPYPAETVTAPCAVVAYPETIDFDMSYSRGSDQCTIPVYFLVGRASEKAARDELAGIVTGATAIKDTLDGNLGGEVQSLRVTEMKILNVQLGGVDYLAAQFNAEVIK